ncbi:response regulator [Chloroflexota bacterium]
MTIIKENILLVDDEETIRCILNKGLAMCGYIFDEAGDAEQALEKLEANPSDLVIMDINMPGRSGSEVLQEITGCFPETAVIMASGVADNNVIAKCIQDGAQDYNNKPFRFEQVLQSVNVALDKRRLELEIQHYFQDMGQEAKKHPLESRKLFLGAIETLVNTLKSSDRYTEGHSEEVAETALAIGWKLGLSAEEMEDLHWAAFTKYNNPCDVKEHKPRCL